MLSSFCRGHETQLTATGSVNFLWQVLWPRVQSAKFRRVRRAPRWTARVAEPEEGKFLRFSTLAEGDTGRPAGTTFGEIGGGCDLR